MAYHSVLDPALGFTVFLTVFAFLGESFFTTTTFPTRSLFVAAETVLERVLFFLVGQSGLIHSVMEPKTIMGEPQASQESFVGVMVPLGLSG